MTSRTSAEKNGHPAIADTNGSIPRPEEKHSLDSRDTFGKARKEETGDDDEEDLLQILQMSAEKNNKKKRTSLAEKEDIAHILQMAADERDSEKGRASLTKKDDVTLADEEYAALAEYSEIELPVGRSSPVTHEETIRMNERMRSSADTRSGEVRGVQGKGEDDFGDDDDDGESYGDDEDDVDDEEDSFHA